MDAAAMTGTDEDRDADREADDHLGDIPDGSGCTEIWEHLSERRSGADDD